MVEPEHPLQGCQLYSGGIEGENCVLTYVYFTVKVSEDTSELNVQSRLFERGIELLQTFRCANVQPYSRVV